MSWCSWIFQILSTVFVMLPWAKGIGQRTAHSHESQWCVLWLQEVELLDGSFRSHSRRTCVDCPKQCGECAETIPCCRVSAVPDQSGERPGSAWKVPGQCWGECEPHQDHHDPVSRGHCWNRCVSNRVIYGWSFFLVVHVTMVCLKIVTHPFVK